MNDPHLPFKFRWTGEPMPDLSSFAEPLIIPFQYIETTNAKKAVLTKSLLETETRAEPVMETSFSRGAVQLAAAGDLKCNGFFGGCQDGGSFGQTAAYRYRNRDLCADCIAKMLGVSDQSVEEKTSIINLFLLKGR